MSDDIKDFVNTAVGNSDWQTNTNPECSSYNFSCSDMTDIPGDECNALVAIYNSNNGKQWNDNTNWLTTNGDWT